jgi:hypothetical protein
MKRALILSGEAGMQLPLPLHTEAQRIASALPLPPVIKSTTPAAVSAASASPSPAGATHRAGAKARAATRAGVGDRLAAHPEILNVPS